MIKQKTEGLIAAPFTPLRADGAVNLNAVDPYARWLHRKGVVGTFICGTTGEGMSLTMEERRQLAERWVAAAAPLCFGANTGKAGSRKSDPVALVPGRAVLTPFRRAGIWA